MSYASLAEIWPNFVVSNKFKKISSTLPKNIVNSLIETSDNRGGNRSSGKSQEQQSLPQPIFYEQSREYPLNDKKTIEKFENTSFQGKYRTECHVILKHLSECSKCRDFVRQKFISQTPIEDDGDDSDDEYLDLAIYIVTGVFILFVLDMLMKFGRRR